MKKEFLAMVLCVVHSSAVLIFVRPDNQKDLCKGMSPHDCNTLSYFAANNSKRLRQDNTKAVFFAGLHITGRNVTLANIQNISLTTEEKEATNDVTIECDESVGFLFQNITDLAITGLAFNRCSRLHRAMVRSSVRLKTGLFFKNITDLMLSAVHVQNSCGYGLFLSEIYGALHVQDCTFQQNGPNASLNGGNAVLAYEQCEEASKANVQITRSRFLQGRSLDMASGLVVLLRCSEVQVNITLMGVVMLGNQVAGQHESLLTECSKGGNLAVLIENCSKYTNISIMDSDIANGRACTGGGLFFQHSTPPIFPTLISLFISNCTFRNNIALDGGAVYLLMNSPDSYSKQNVTVRGCSFVENRLQISSNTAVGVAMSITSIGLWTAGLSLPLVVLSECHFLHNRVVPPPEEPDSHAYAAVASVLAVALHSGQVHIMEGCFFKDNTVTGVSAFHTTLEFSGNVTFYNNSAYVGGGIALREDSYILMSRNTTLTLSNNNASFTGGGIFVDDSYSQVSEPCFYQVDPGDALTVDGALNSMKIKLLNNLAKYGGDQIYGGRIDKCSVQRASANIFDKLFELHNRDGQDLSVISSDPVSVHFCHAGVPVSDMVLHRRVYSGELFNVSAVLLGQQNGTTSGRVRFTVRQSEKSTSRIKSNLTATSPKGCSNYSIAVYTRGDYDILDVTAAKHVGTSSLLAKHIRLYFLPPPLGFVSTGSDPPYQCIQSPNISAPAYRFSCVLGHSKSYIVRPPPYWLGYVSHDNVSQFVLYYQCPIDYCQRGRTKITTDSETFHQDDQCAYNHAGTLCGQCKAGFSLSLGSSVCLNCTDTSFGKTLGASLGLATIGLVLVFTLLTLNLTVTSGTLSGNLFYTNIFYYYWATLLPNFKIHSISKLKAFFKVFIFGNSLVLSCDRCLYDGLGVIGRTWMQFILVVYFWALAGAIIWVSRRFACVNKHIGSNAVSTLATIILYSHTSMNLAITHSLSMARLSFPGPGNATAAHEHVLLYDGNIPYFSSRHIPLFIAGCIFAVFSVCFTLILLCVQPLQRYSHLCPFRWVNKLKPLLDAYTCPHIIKPHCRFWNGFLLLVRMALYIVISTPLGSNYRAMLDVLSIACLIVIVVSLVFGGVYTKRYLNVLFLSYVINLGLLAVVARDLIPSKKRNNFSNTGLVITSLISLGVATTTSFGVLGYHTYQRLKTVKILGKLRRLCSLCLNRSLPTRNAVPNYQALGPCVGDTCDDRPYVTASTSSDLEIPRNLHPPLSVTYREPQLIDYDST